MEIAFIIMWNCDELHIYNDEPKPPFSHYLLMHLFTSLPPVYVLQKKTVRWSFNEQGVQNHQASDAVTSSLDMTFLFLVFQQSYQQRYHHY
jgi:hypothetical protein